MHGLVRDSPEFREVVDDRTWCPTDDRAGWVRTPSWSDARDRILAFSMEVGRKDRGLHARIGIPLVGREKRGDVIQSVNGARGARDDRSLDFSGLFWGIREGR